MTYANKSNGFDESGSSTGMKDPNKKDGFMESGSSPPNTNSTQSIPTTPPPDQGRKPPAPNLVHLSSLSDEWQTPMIYLDSAREALGGIDLDPAAGDEENKRRVGAKVAYDINDDGLAQDWKGNTFLNPPYGKLAKLFIEKLLFHVENGDVESAVVLLAVPHMAARWLRPLFDAASSICITDHPKFEPIKGQKAQSPPSGLDCFCIGDSYRVFEKAFEKHGAVLSICVIRNLELGERKGEQA